MTERPDLPEDADPAEDPDQPEPTEPKAAGPGPAEPEQYTGPTGYLHARGENIPEEVERTPSGGLPVAIIVIAAVIFIAGFWLFRRWRGQYVDYGDIGGWAEQLLQPVLAVFGLG